MMCIVCWCQAGRGCEFDDGVSLGEVHDSSQTRIPADADFVQVCSTTEGLYNIVTCQAHSSLCYLSE